MAKAPQKLAFLAALLACLALPAGAQRAAAVLAKGSGLYFDTYLAFQKAYGRPVVPFDLSENRNPELPGGLRVVAAFGTRAAALKYPKGVTVIYALAPTYTPDLPGPDFVRVSPLPEPGSALTTYLRLQPGLKRLAVFYSPGDFDFYLDKLDAAAREAGIKIVRSPLSSPTDFPEALRSLVGRIDAFWLLPEPALIDLTSLHVLGEFSCSNKVPFYAPSGGLTNYGAAAAFAPGYLQTGEAVARALKTALAGGKLPGLVFPDYAVLTLNAAAIRKCGLPLVTPPGQEGK